MDERDSLTRFSLVFAVSMSNHSNGARGGSIVPFGVDFGKLTGNKARQASALCASVDSKGTQSDRAALTHAVSDSVRSSGETMGEIN